MDGSRVDVMSDQNYLGTDNSMFDEKMKAAFDDFFNPFIDIFVAQFMRTMRELKLDLFAEKRRRKLRRRNFYKSGKHTGFKRRWRRGRR